MKSAWYELDPYQYLENGRENGLDIEILRNIILYTSRQIKFKNVEWNTQLKNIKIGKQDIVSGATYTKERSKYAYFSKSYRKEENSFFVKKGSIKKFNLKGSGVKEVLAVIKKNKLNIAVIDGFIYADKDINDYVNDPKNNDHIIKTSNDLESINLLLNSRVDGFFADRLAAATIAWRIKKRNKIEEYYLGISVPIHFMLSKKSISKSYVKQFDNAVNKLVKSTLYSEILRQYITPVLLLQTIGQSWFITIDIIGTIAFAISGIILAYRRKSTLLDAFVFAALPSVGGATFRDILVGLEPISVIGSPIYFIIICGLVLFFFVVVRIWDKGFLMFWGSKFSTRILDFADSIGQATTTMSGVVIAVATKSDPLWLWGPVFATITGTGGGLLRDSMMDKESMAELPHSNNDSFRPEVSFFWGLVATLMLYLEGRDVRPDYIYFTVLTCTIGCFINRVIMMKYKTPKLMFVPTKKREKALKNKIKAKNLQIK